MQWKISETDPRGVTQLADDCKISSVLAGVLANRGLRTPSLVHDFLNPSLGCLPNPFLLPDMDRAVLRLIEAVNQNELITIYGDYDADGVTATALLMEFFQELGARVNYYIPHRIDEGYGLNPRAVEQLHQNGTTLLVTVDCGVSDFAGAQKARELGVDLIITDHHQPPPELPDALAVINPQRGGHQFPQKELAGVGVAFFLAGGLRQALRENGVVSKTSQPELAPYLGLVSIGTVADVMPLVYINRILVSVGLSHLAETRNPGLTALKQIGMIDPGRPPSSTDIAFRLAPRLNAAGRLGSAQPSLDVLMCRDPETAKDLVEELERLNKERRKVQDQTLREALNIIKENGGKVGSAIVLAKEGWLRGVVGLAASKLAEQYGRPAILLAVEDGLAKGSGRSIKGFNLYKALCHCRDFMVAFGGHEQAAGLTVETDRVSVLTEAFESIASQSIDPTEDLEPTLEVDALVGPEDLDCLAAELPRLSPFGAGNPEPVFGMTGLSVYSASVVGNKHLKMTLGRNGRAVQTIGFGLGDLLPELGPRVDVAIRQHVSTYQGRTSNGWKLVDVRKPRPA